MKAGISVVAAMCMHTWDHLHQCYTAARKYTILAAALEKGLILFADAGGKRKTNPSAITHTGVAVHCDVVQGDAMH
jgi:hypothetical protein